MLFLFQGFIYLKTSSLYISGNNFLCPLPDGNYLSTLAACNQVTVSSISPNTAAIKSNTTIYVRGTNFIGNKFFCYFGQGRECPIDFNSFSSFKIYEIPLFFSRLVIALSLIS